jgi:hypothetical protein
MDKERLLGILIEKWTIAEAEARGFQEAARELERNIGWGKVADLKIFRGTRIVVIPGNHSGEAGQYKFSRIIVRPYGPVKAILYGYQMLKSGKFSKREDGIIWVEDLDFVALKE